jgi:hypothetical protein
LFSKKPATLLQKRVWLKEYQGARWPLVRFIVFHIVFWSWQLNNVTFSIIPAPGGSKNNTFSIIPAPGGSQNSICSVIPAPGGSEKIRFL